MIPTLNFPALESHVTPRRWRRGWFVALILALALVAHAGSNPTWDQVLSQANARKQTGKVDSARVLGHLALDLARRSNGAADSSIALILHRLGVFWHRESLDSAQHYYQKALAVWNALGQAHLANKAKTLNNIGAAYLNTARFSKALAVFEEAAAIKESALDPYHMSLSTAYYYLGEVNRSLGRYLDAEKYMRRCLEIRDSILPPNHRSVAGAQNSLGNIYFNLSDHKRAAYWYEKALSTTRAAGEKTPIGFLSNLALALLALGDLDRAESLFVSILADSGRQYTENVNAHYLAMNNLGLTLQAKHEYQRSVETLESAVPLCAEVYGTEHEEYARLLRNLGLSRLYLRDYDRAKQLLTHSLELRRELLSEFHTDIAHSLRGLGSWYRLRGQTEQAAAMLDSAFAIHKEVVRRFTPFLPMSSALEFADGFVNARDYLLSALRDLWSQGHDVSDRIATLVFQTKGEVSDEIIRRQLFARASLNPQLETMLDRYHAVQSQLFERLTGPSNHANDSLHSRTTDSLTFLAQRLEQQLLHSTDPKRQRASEPITPCALARRLPDDAVLIEYCRYFYDPDSSEEKSPYYFAVVLTSNQVSAAIDLGAGGSADSLTEAYRRHMAAVADTDRMPSSQQEHDYERIAAALYDYFLAPVVAHLENADQLFVAPDGGLNLISLAGLVDHDGRYLAERWPIHYLSSGRDLLRLEHKTAPGSGLLAVGDPDFRHNSVMASAKPDSKRTFHQYEFENPALRDDNRTTRAQSLESLPNTRREIATVTDSWSDYSDDPTVTLLGPDASEANVLARAPGKRVIYIATHGFFSDNHHTAGTPFLQCGLYFAPSGQLTSLGQKTPSDGIVTGQDIVMLDLTGTELVVLSACESAVGHIAQGEGIFGLRRAFQMAGAQTVISSLWRVPDAFTADMMGRLFEAGRNEIPSRMRSVQLAQLRHLRRNNLSDHPFSWAAFVATGDWR